jgi:sulfatase maturation enzyme AslB (radical SAM superfamily)
MNQDIMQIAITGKCDLKCPYCWEITNGCNYEDMTADEVVQILTRAYEVHKAQDKFLIVKFFGGEPLLRYALIQEVVTRLRDIPDFTRYIKLWVITNALHLDRAKIDWFRANGVFIQVSIDCDPAKSERYTTDAQRRAIYTFLDILRPEDNICTNSVLERIDDFDEDIRWLLKYPFGNFEFYFKYDQNITRGEYETIKRKLAELPFDRRYQIEICSMNAVTVYDKYADKDEFNHRFEKMLGIPWLRSDLCGVVYKGAARPIVYNKVLCNGDCTGINGDTACFRLNKDQVVDDSERHYCPNLAVYDFERENPQWVKIREFTARNLNMILTYKNEGDPTPLIQESVNVCVTNRCNYKCPYCLKTGYENYEEVGLAEYIAALDSIPTLNSFTITGGEPTLRPDVVEGLLRYAVRRNMMSRLFTNGSNLTEGILKALASSPKNILAYSFDGLDNWDFERAAANIRRLNKTGITPSVTFVTYENTVHRLYENWRFLYDSDMVNMVHFSPGTQVPANVEWTERGRDVLFEQSQMILEDVRAELMRGRQLLKIDTVDNWLTLIYGNYTHPTDPFAMCYKTDMLGTELALDSDGKFKLHGMGAFCRENHEVLGDWETGLDVGKYCAEIERQLEAHRRKIMKFCDGTCGLCNNVPAYYCVNTVRGLTTWMYIDRNHCYSGKFMTAFGIAALRLYDNPCREDTNLREIFNSIENTKRGEYLPFEEFIGVERPERLRQSIMPSFV